MTKTFRQSGVCRAVLIAAATLVVSAGASRADDMTGNWVDVDTGDTVSIRQIGDDVWWVARSADGGKAWTDMFHGKLEGKKLTGHFADIPEGKNRNQGSYVGRVVVRDDGNVLELDGEFTYSPDNNTSKRHGKYKRAD
ncbi:MAG TPA: hypothetical protein VMS17_09005 [Gemmataceae bacterium]|nr:hypothetical protein [Gemmataceae bacterium]